MKTLSICFGIPIMVVYASVHSTPITARCSNWQSHCCAKVPFMLKHFLPTSTGFILLFSLHYDDLSKNIYFRNIFHIISCMQLGQYDDAIVILSLSAFDYKSYLFQYSFHYMKPSEKVFSQFNIFITRKILQNNFGIHRTTCFYIITLGKRFACCAAKQQIAPNWCTCNAKFPTRRCNLKIIRANASLHGVLFMAWRLGTVIFRCLFCIIIGFFEYKLPHLFFHDWGMLDALYDSFGNITYIIKRFWQHFG